MSGRYLQLQCRVELRDHGNICIVLKFWHGSCPENDSVEIT